MPGTSHTLFSIERPHPHFPDGCLPFSCLSCCIHSQRIIRSTIRYELSAAKPTNSKKLTLADLSARSDMDRMMTKGTAFNEHTWATAAPSISTQAPPNSKY